MTMFITRSILYILILSQVTQSILWVALTAFMVAVLETISYFKGKDDAIEELVKAKVIKNGN